LNIDSFKRGQETGLLVKIGWSDSTRENRQRWLCEGFRDGPALAEKDDWVIEGYCWWNIEDDAQIEDDVLRWFRRRHCGFYKLYWPLLNGFRDQHPQAVGHGGLTEVMLICDVLKLKPAKWRSLCTPQIIREILVYVSLLEREWAIAERMRHLTNGGRSHVGFLQEGVATR